MRVLEVECVFQKWYGALVLFSIYFIPMMILSVLICAPSFILTIWLENNGVILLHPIAAILLFIQVPVIAIGLDLQGVRRATAMTRRNALAIGKVLDRIDYHCCTPMGAIAIDLEKRRIAIIDGSYKELHPLRCIFHKPHRHPSIFPIDAVEKVSSHNESYRAPEGSTVRIPGSVHGTVGHNGNISATVTGGYDMQLRRSLISCIEERNRSRVLSGITFDLNSDADLQVYVPLAVHTSVWFSLLSEATSGSIQKQKTPKLYGSNVKRTFIVKLKT